MNVEDRLVMNDLVSQKYNLMKSGNFMTYTFFNA